MTFTTKFLISLFLANAHCTIDINLPELEYLADHLHHEECRKLVAALHFKSYGEPNALDQAERKVPKDLSCLRLLLHWNSEKGEGKGETHEAVEHRLRQIGRADLADWLCKTVFQQLGKDLARSMDSPFKDIVNATEKTHQYKPIPLTQAPVQDEDAREWTAFDTICYTLSSLIFVAVLLIFFRVMCISCCGKLKRRKRKLATKHYKELENDSSDSEDQFDIRNYS